MSQLEIPSDLLVRYAGEVLGLKSEADEIDQVQQNPISILTSVFILNLPLLEIKFSEKMLRQGAKEQPKEEEFSKDSETYDSMLKVLFKINIWICKNEQGFFTDLQRARLG